jgi:hypothetical protein
MFSACLSVFMQAYAFAEWEPDSVRTLSGDCTVSEIRLDETKITFQLFDFSAAVSGNAAGRSVQTSSCVFDVQFRVPPSHRLKDLSNRIFARAEKDTTSSLSLTASVTLNNEEFIQTGKLMQGSSFSGRLLLYKSYDVRNIVSCSPDEQRIHLRMSVDFRAEAEPAAGPVVIGMLGEDEWIDLWMDVERC